MEAKEVYSASGSARSLNAVVESVSRSISFGGAEAQFDPDLELRDLRLEPTLAGEFHPHFESLGYGLEDKTKLDPFGYGERQYTAAVAVSGMEIAVLQISTVILRTDSAAFVYAFLGMLYTFQGATCRLLSEEVPVLDWGFERAFKDRLTGGNSRFINWDIIQKFRDGRLKVPFAELFQLEQAPVNLLTQGSTKRELGESQIKRILAVLSGSASSNPGGAKNYFEYVTSESDWPDRWKQQVADIWSGNADQDARELFNYAKPRSYPSGHTKQGQSVLGWLLQRRLENQELVH